MFILRLETNASAKDLLIAELWDRGTAGITEEETPDGGILLSAFFDETFDTVDLAACNPRWETAEDRDWVAVSQSLWSPVLVGDRFYLVPEWMKDPSPPGRIRLSMHPGQACGTGWHQATQLCLEAMERYLRPGLSVLDVGTGSGILSVAASLLGAARIFACDIDTDAVVAAAARFREEGASARAFAGSVRSVRDAAADLVIANINAETLVALAPDILRVRKPGGRLILSGFSQRETARVREAFGACGGTLEKENWVALVC